MRPSLPDGWPGLVGIVVLLAGILAVLARPTLTPLGGSAGSAAGFLPEFYWASIQGPMLPLDLSGAAAAHAEASAFFDALGADAYEERRIYVVGTFPSAESARAAADVLDLPHGAAMLVQDRVLIVVGLRSVVDVAAGATAGETDVTVLVEGDRGGEGSIVLDLSCAAPSSEVAAQLATSIGDYGAIPHYAHLRPPWTGAALTGDEALARATYRRWSQGYALAFQNDPYLGEWGRRYLAADSAAERDALNEELTEHLGRRQPDLGGDAHPGVMALLASTPDGSEPGGYERWGRELGRLMGQLSMADDDAGPTWYEQRHAGSIGSAQAVREKLEIGWASFNVFALGGSGLLSYLDEHGCVDALVTLSDFDDVRGD